jgi:hypothetical protein
MYALYFYTMKSDCSFGSIHAIHLEDSNILDAYTYSILRGTVYS